MMNKHSQDWGFSEMRERTKNKRSPCSVPSDIDLFMEENTEKKLVVFMNEEIQTCANLHL